MNIGGPFYDPNTGTCTSSTTTASNNSTSLTLQHLNQARSLVNYNAKYTPPVQTWSNTFISAGPSGYIGHSGARGISGYIGGLMGWTELPKGSTPVDSLKRALMLASAAAQYWTADQVMLPAYSPGYVRDISKLHKLKNRMIKDIAAPAQQSYGAYSEATIYPMVVRMPGAPPLFTYMTFHICPYTPTTFLDMDEDMSTVPNNLLFIASQHKEFSVGVIPYDGEEKRDEMLKSVKEFVEGFCDINVKPLMVNLIQVFMGNIVFLAPSKRVASLAKALFNVKYITVMSMPKYKASTIALVSYPGMGSIAGWTGTTGITTGISGINMSGSYVGAPYTAVSSTTTTWTKLQGTLTNSMNSIKNYFTSNNVSS